MNSPQDAIEAGIALIPEDRLREGVIAQHSVGSNITLPVLDRISRYAWVSDARAAGIDPRADHSTPGIKAESADTFVNTFFLGWQPAESRGREVAGHDAEHILVLDEPAAGIDIGSKSEIVRIDQGSFCAQRMRNSADLLGNASAALASCDRIVVMSDGHIVSDIPRRQLDLTSSTG